MSHRRGGGGPKEAVKKEEEMVPFNESLDQPKIPLTMDRDGDVPEENKVAQPIASLSLDERYETEASNLKEKLWKENPFAVGLGEPTWEEEYANFKRNPKQQCMDTAEAEGVPCICCSAMVCGAIGAGRVGNMAVLKQSTEWVEEVEQDENNVEKIRRFTRPKLDIVVGPYWPMLVLVTYPLILGVSAVTLFTAVPGKHPLIQLPWAICTLGLIYALAMTAFRDPGILPKYEKPPPQNENGWRWSDRAYSFRPRGAFFDTDTGVIVDGFDHTCPWTGTAIGSKNMLAFQCFVALVFICLMFDIILLTGGIR